MSSKTRTRKNHTTHTTGSTRIPQPVPIQTATPKARTEAEDKLWEALDANPNSTVTNLADAARIGKSTAGKILAKWAKDDSVTRTPGIAQGGGRAADLWAINTSDDTTNADAAPAGGTAPEDAARNADPAIIAPIYEAVPADSSSPGTESAESVGGGPGELTSPKSPSTESAGTAADTVSDVSETARWKEGSRTSCASTSTRSTVRPR
jgi:hypothetical protein